MNIMNHTGIIISYFNKINLSEEFRDDCFQECIEAMIKISDRYDEEKGNPYTFFYPWVKTATLKWLKNNFVVKVPDRCKDKPVTTDEYWDSFDGGEIEIEEIQNLIGILSDEQQIAITRYFFYGETMKEIAKREECSHQAIDARIKRGLENLRNLV